MVRVKQWVVTPCSLAVEQWFLRNTMSPIHVHNFSVSIRTRAYRMDLKTLTMFDYLSRKNVRPIEFHKRRFLWIFRSACCLTLSTCGIT